MLKIHNYGNYCDTLDKNIVYYPNLDGWGGNLAPPPSIVFYAYCKSERPKFFDFPK